MQIEPIAIEPLSSSNRWPDCQKVKSKRSPSSLAKPNRAFVDIHILAIPQRFIPSLLLAAYSDASISAAFPVKTREPATSTPPIKGGEPKTAGAIRSSEKARHSSAVTDHTPPAPREARLREPPLTVTAYRGSQTPLVAHRKNRRAPPSRGAARRL